MSFKFNSYECCSVAEDKTMKVWDAAQRGFMENFFGHRQPGHQIVPLTEEYMVSGGFDKRAIVWKIPQQNQLQFKERDYSLDCVCAVDPKHFVTGSQDG